MATHRDRNNDVPKSTSRRTFLKRGGAGLLGAGIAAPLREVAAAAREGAGPQPAPVGAVPERITRTWIGPHYWGNRLQDWRIHDGRIECLTGGELNAVRTVGILNREMLPDRGGARISALVTLLDAGEAGGFGGFLIGSGAGNLDWRGAALVQKASGIGGGLMCVFETDGKIRFREHTNEEDPLAYDTLPADEAVSAGSIAAGTTVQLVLTIEPQDDTRYAMTMQAHSPISGDVLSSATLRDVTASSLPGGLLLVSSPYPGKNGARWAFRDVTTSGTKIAERPERSLGPIAGTLFSLNKGVLKLSTQLMPVGDAEPQRVSLEVRPKDRGTWQERATAPLQQGYTALFRLEDWDAAQDWEYRVVYVDGTGERNTYEGVIRRDPVDKNRLTVGLMSCVLTTVRSLEGGTTVREMPGSALLGRYTHECMYFPHAELIKNAAQHEPDVVAFVGDQLYEWSPSRIPEEENPITDYLYKWYLWMWPFRELTRSTPAIILVDDHDVFHGNIWGEGGELAPEVPMAWNYGGYIKGPEFVNTVQRTQCSHNPDPYDSDPVKNDITVYYGAFEYGGVSFAMLEDRKFKTSPVYGEDLDVHEPQLLGERQERFLADWAVMDADAKVCFTQTLFACVQTSPAGVPLLDFDSNGYPTLPRDRAVALLRDAGALVLAGDQHMASIVRHGVETHTDGPLQFCGPAAGSFWQRWFEPAEPLPNGTGDPNTGDFRDSFGNKVRVLAVANPLLTFREFREHIKGRTQALGDRSLKREGYGIIHIDRRDRAFHIECWPWNEDPTAAGASQFEGWPYRLPFNETKGG